MIEELKAEKSSLKWVHAESIEVLTNIMTT
jgi:hypothetical protein